MSFDADTFLTQTIDAPLSEFVEPIPEGDYPAMIDDFDSSAVEQVEFTYKKGPNAGSPGTMTKLTINWVIQDEALKARLDRDKVTARQQIILDIADNGGLDFGKGKNVTLGQLRAAVGQNAAGAWSIMNLRGAGPAMIHVGHRQDKNNPERKYAEVTRVAPLR